MEGQHQSFEELQMERGEAEVLIAWKVLGRRHQKEALGRMVLLVTLPEEASSLGQAGTSDSQREGDEHAIEESLASGVEG
jgi:hypothetical protein